MLKRVLTAIAALLVTSAVFAQAYRWVDENGVVHFSDRPHPGAEEIQLPQSQASSRSTTSTRPTGPRRSTTRGSGETQPAEEADGPFQYESIEISSPASEETLWNIEGVLNVSVSLQPALQPGHQVRVYMDGQPQDVSGTSFQLQEVWRGAHNIQAEVLDENGRLMIRSLPIRFYVQQNSIGGP